MIDWLWFSSDRRGDEARNRNLRGRCVGGCMNIEMRAGRTEGLVQGMSRAGVSLVVTILKALSRRGIQCGARKSPRRLLFASCVSMF
jgi:hypothetical protein